MRLSKTIMPKFNTEILGSKIEINYEEKEREKLINLINNFKRRLREFPNNGRISNITIMFLAALRAEDQLVEIKTLVANHKVEENKKKEYIKNIELLNKTVVSLKDEINKLNLTIAAEKKKNVIIVDEVNNLEFKIEQIRQKMKNSLSNE